MQNRERAVSLGMVDFGNDAHVVLWQPGVSADRRPTAIVVVGIHHHTLLASEGAGCDSVQRLLRAANLWPEAPRHIAARIAKRDIKNGLSILGVRQQSDPYQLLVKAAVGNHQALLVDGIGLARLAHATHLEDLCELALGTDPQAESGNHLLIGVMDRSDDEHGRNAGSPSSALVCHDNIAGEWSADGHLAF